MNKIKLTQGQFAEVDDEDYEWLNQWKWCALKHRNTFYAVRGIEINGKWTTQYMHILIMGDNPLKLNVDHRDGYGTNNHRSNLRFCTSQENSMNRVSPKNCSSEYVGVCWNKRSCKWVAYILAEGIRKHLGYFHNEEDAARAFDAATLERNPKFNRLNFPI